MGLKTNIFTVVFKACAEDQLVGLVFRIGDQNLQAGLLKPCAEDAFGPRNAQQVFNGTQLARYTIWVEFKPIG